MDRSLKSYTSRHLIVTHETDSLESAFGVMSENQVRHLPVVSSEGGIVGIISDRDFRRAMKGGQSKFDPSSRVVDYMSWPVESIDSNASLNEAARALIDHKISALLVTEKDQVVGIVTSEDLLRSLLLALETPAERVKREVQEAAYSSPVGQIAHVLAQAGI